MTRTMMMMRMTKRTTAKTPATPPSTGPTVGEEGGKEVGAPVIGVVSVAESVVVVVVEEVVVVVGGGEGVGLELWTGGGMLATIDDVGSRIEVEPLSINVESTMVVVGAGWAGEVEGAGLVALKSPPPSPLLPGLVAFKSPPPPPLLPLP